MVIILLSDFPGSGILDTPDMSQVMATAWQFILQNNAVIFETIHVLSEILLSKYTISHLFHKQFYTLICHRN